MPPWPSGVDLQYPANPAPYPSVAAPRSHISASTAGDPPSSSRGRHARNRSRVATLDPLKNLQLHAADSSSSDESVHPPSRRPPFKKPYHGRSISHPFPSLFAGQGKRKQVHTGVAHSGPDSTDDICQMLGRKKSLPQSLVRGHRTTFSQDYATGNCMTCSSLVRWPKNLQVFRCTVCQTINDLPSESERDVTDAHRIDPISLEHCKVLADRCLHDFLLATLRKICQPHSPDRQDPSVRQPSYPPAETPLSPHGRDAMGQALTLRPKPRVPYIPNPFVDGLNEPTLHLSPPKRKPLPSHSHLVSADRRPDLNKYAEAGPPSRDKTRTLSGAEDGKRIFKALEDYIVNSVTSLPCINSSFMAHRSAHIPKPPPTAERSRRLTVPRQEPPNGSHPLTDLDPKLLLIGDVAENGLWWTGNQTNAGPRRSASHRSEGGSSIVSMRSPHINWSDVDDWYGLFVNLGRRWTRVYDVIVKEDASLVVPDSMLSELEAEVLAGQEHCQRALLKAIQTLLKRPRMKIQEPHQLRFLLIFLSNPLLHSRHRPYPGKFEHPLPPDLRADAALGRQGFGPASGRHSGIIKRILGLMSNTPSECHIHLQAWLARYSETRFIEVKDLVSGFLAYRLARQNDKKWEAKDDPIDRLIPSISTGRSPAQLHASLGQRFGHNKKEREKLAKMVYQDDWQMKAAAQVMACIFVANNSVATRRSNLPNTGEIRNHQSIPLARDTVQTRGQILASSDFYMTLLDDSDLVADFEAWEKKRGKFSFCQYPFLLSIGAKIQILEHDARRQMQTKARDAFFDSIMTRRNVEQFLTLSIRRDCLVEDSLKAVSEVVGAGGEDIKKGLRITFTGEEGVDAGGLRKEWFLLLVREVFNPDHGMFIYDDDSQYCYFNPHSFEPSEQFFLVGIVFGLAIYNSTILDVALPPFAFRKLLMAAPPTASASLATALPRQSMVYTLDDLAEYRPRLAAGLRQLLDFEGDVESTFCLDFVIETDKYGLPDQIPLCPGGERRAVTNSNRREFVDLYVNYILDLAVVRQFEPFKRGFYTVCAGNALSLFRAEEIELLVRGSDEALDIGSLKTVAAYENWRASNPAETEPTVRWFWETFESASPQDQRRLLLFITGSDRIPAMGAGSLAIRLACLGEDCGRFPTARTCFNVVSLYRYKSRERLESMLWTAVRESEGFGLK